MKVSFSGRAQNWVYRNILDKKPTKAYLALGSNLGEREQFLADALDRLAASAENQILQVSSIYETEPVGCPGGGWFLNQAVYLVTLQPLYLFFSQIQGIEAALGRESKGDNAPRRIDIDLLFFGEHRVEDPDLTLPHPRLHERAFVLEPLAEINPLLWHPVFQKSVSELLESLPRTHEVRRAVPAAR